MKMKKKLRSFARHIRHWFPVVYGPRGWALVGFAIVSLSFSGLYLLPFSASDNVRGPLGYEFWGYIWLASGIWMLISAVKVDQAKALGLFAGVLFLTGATYLFTGSPIRAVMFWGLSWACFCVGRMINPAEEHTEEVIRPGPPGQGEPDGLD